jgi:hypothetical protein
MNEKALVEIFVPASGETFDVFIPLASKMSDVIKMVSGALTELSNGRYRATDDAVLCDAATGIIFNVNIEVAELGIKNGSRLMLI